MLVAHVLQFSALLLAQLHFPCFGHDGCLLVADRFLSRIPSAARSTTLPDLIFKVHYHVRLEFHPRWGNGSRGRHKCGPYACRSMWYPTMDIPQGPIDYSARSRHMASIQ